MASELGLTRTSGRESLWVCDLNLDPQELLSAESKVEEDNVLPRRVGWLRRGGSDSWTLYHLSAAGPWFIMKVALNE